MNTYLKLVVGAVVVVTLLVLAAMSIHAYTHSVYRLADVSRYEEFLARTRRQVPADAAAHMPDSIAAVQPSTRLVFADAYSDHGLTLILRCNEPTEKIAASLDGWRRRSIPIRRITLNHIENVRSFYGPNWQMIESEADSFRGLPDDYELLLLYHDGPSAGMNMFSSGIAVRESDGTVLYWVHHHWAPHN